MEKYFVPLAEAEELKQMGFSEECLAYWFINNLVIGDPGEYQGLPAPLYDQAFAWFREKHNLYTSLRPDASVNEILGFEAHIVSWRFWPRKEVGYFHGYQEAQLETLRALIKMLKP